MVVVWGLFSGDNGGVFVMTCETANLETGDGYGLEGGLNLLFLGCW